MTDTRKRWIKVCTVLGMVLDGVPSEKTEKFSNFLNFFENVIFLIFNLFFIKNILLLGRLKIDFLADVSQWNGLKITSIG